MAVGGFDKGIIAQAINRQFDIAKLDLELPAFAARQHSGAKMIADLEFKTLLVVDHQ